MSTSITYSTVDGFNLLGRNFDFRNLKDKNIFMVPRNYRWFNKGDYKQIKTKYAILGMAAPIRNHLVFVDGLNEHGLMAATLPFNNYSYYEPERSNIKENIEGYDLIFYTLCNYKNVEELRENIYNINLICDKLPIINTIPPLHWIFNDSSGDSVIIEKTVSGLKIYNNLIGVITNEPDYPWHLSNLYQYKNLIEKKDDINEISLGIPGDTSSQSRFIRAAYIKRNIPDVNTEILGVTNVFKILNFSNITKGIKFFHDTEEIIFTMYTSVMCGQTRSYYFNCYENSEINCIKLLDEDLDFNKIKRYAVKEDQVINYLN